jgi:hypothetical protein
MEDDLKDFFLMVANYPLPDNAEKYVETMGNIPGKVIRDDYVTWLRFGFERRLGREKINGFVYPMYESKVYALFSDDDFKDFELNREMLISVLNEIVGGESFFAIKCLSKITGFASSLQSREVFGISTENGIIEKTTYHPKLTDDTDELEGIFALACHGLVSFLADSKQGGRDRIRKCAQCNNFFLWERKDGRNRFCSADCRNLHNRLQRKTSNGRAERKEYMRRYRKETKKRRQKEKREEEIRRLMDSRYTRSQAEKIVDDADT